MNAVKQLVRNLIKEDKSIFWGVTIYISVLLFGVFFTASDLYYPIRLYYIGTYQKDTIKCIYIHDYHENQLPITGYYIEGKKYNFDVPGQIPETLNPGDSIIVFGSTEINKAVYLGNREPTKFNLVFAYSQNGFFGILLAVAVLTLNVASGIYALSIMLKMIFKDTNEEITPEHMHIEKVAVYVKNYLPVIILLGSAYVFFAYLIRAFLIIESKSELAVGTILSVASGLVLSIPLFIFLIYRYFQKTKNKKIRIVKTVLACIISIYLTKEIVELFYDYSVNSHKDFIELLEHLGEYLFPL